MMMMMTICRHALTLVPLTKVQESISVISRERDKILELGEEDWPPMETLHAQTHVRLSKDWLQDLGELGTTFHLSVQPAF